MTSARKVILDRVRDALGSRSATQQADYKSIERAYQRSGTSNEEKRRNLLIERLEDYGASVSRCRNVELPRTIGIVLGQRGKHGMVIPATLPRDWLPHGFNFVPDIELAPEVLDQSEGVLTGCTVAIALTGTIVLRHGVAEGRRALTLIPDYHLCILHEDKIVETVAEGLHRTLAEPIGLVTTISGPSATADIEMTRVKGVHGPRILDVVLVET